MVGLAVLAALTALALTACGAADPGTGPRSAASSSAVPSSSASMTPATPTSAAETTSPAGRCGAPVVPGARAGSIVAEDRSRLPVVTVGSGTTTVLFLPQTDEVGLCGFWPFATWLASTRHVRAVLVDLCGYADTQCADGPFADDQLAQVALAATWARTTSPGTRRLVVVGASMGGALALASAPRIRADAVIDLSGPPDWFGAEAPAAAERVRVPTLVACSPNDTNTNYDKLRAAFATIRARPARFVVGAGAHGWGLLPGTTSGTWSPLAVLVADWVVGRYR